MSNNNATLNCQYRNITVWIYSNLFAIHYITSAESLCSWKIILPENYSTRYTHFPQFLMLGCLMTGDMHRLSRQAACGATVHPGRSPSVWPSSSYWVIRQQHRLPYLDQSHLGCRLVHSQHFHLDAGDLHGCCRMGVLNKLWILCLFQRLITRPCYPDVPFFFELQLCLGIEWDIVW